MKARQLVRIITAHDAWRKNTGAAANLAIRPAGTLHMKVSGVAAHQRLMLPHHCPLFYSRVPVFLFLVWNAVCLRDDACDP